MREVAHQAENVQKDRENTVNNDNKVGNGEQDTFLHTARKTTDKISMLPKADGAQREDKMQAGVRRKRDLHEAQMCLKAICTASGRLHFVHTSETSDEETKRWLLY